MQHVAWYDALNHKTLEISADRTAARFSYDAAGKFRLLEQETPDGDGWAQRERQRLQQGDAAVVSVYARGRDYHKVVRQRLQQLADFVVPVAVDGLRQVALGDAAAMPVRAMLKHFRPEFEAMIKASTQQAA